jgi:hypothetical protein
MLARHSSRFLPALFVSLAGCGGSVANNNPADAAPIADSGTTSHETGAPAADSGVHDVGVADTGVDATGPAGTVDGQVSIGPLHLASAEERTVCVVMPLAAARDFVATDLHMSLSAGSHHAVAYRSTDTSPSPTMTDCQPLGGVTGGTAPLIIAQHDGDALKLPSGIGLPLAATQMIKLELHAINTTHNPIDVNATFHVSGPDAGHATSLQPADLAFWGTMGINIGPHATASTGIMYQQAIAGTHGFAVTTHQHHLGTDFKVWKSAGGHDVTESTPPLGDNTVWSDPNTFYFSPTLDFDGTNGLAYECTWNNTTDKAVGFGESALDEMCFLWMYYYPSRGFDTCLNTPCAR